MNVTCPEVSLTEGLYVYTIIYLPNLWSHSLLWVAERRLRRRFEVDARLTGILIFFLQYFCAHFFRIRNPNADSFAFDCDSRYDLRTPTLHVMYYVDCVSFQPAFRRHSSLLVIVPVTVSRRSASVCVTPCQASYSYLTYC